MTVLLDQGACIGCGVCVAACRSVFRFTPKRRAEIWKQPDEAEKSAVENAMLGCPVTAIHKGSSN